MLVIAAAVLGPQVLFVALAPSSAGMHRRSLSPAPLREPSGGSVSPLRAVTVSDEVGLDRKQLVEQYALDSDRQMGVAEGKKALRGSDGLTAEEIAFDQRFIWDFVRMKFFSVLQRGSFIASVAVGIWWAWRGDPGQEDAQRTYVADSLRRSGPESPRGKALRSGLAEMGVFFVKMGQTLAQRPDLVGDEVAEELKGLQERNSPFPDEVALKIMAEDLKHDGPLAPGVLPPGGDASKPCLLKELNPKHVASASLGQVYKGTLDDGRVVAFKVQRPGVREILSTDWAVAVVACKCWQLFTEGINDYSLIVDTVGKGIKMEVDYHNEAAHADEFAMRHAFLPFVSSPGWIPEYTGPVGSARVLALDWYPSRAPSELNREERRRLVEMAVEACVVQLLVTGFVHADPHEGNLRLGDDGRVVFLDFGLMDRVDFGVMECFAAGVRHVLSEDWTELSRCMQEVRFTPNPLLKYEFLGGRNKRIVECSLEEFSNALGAQMKEEAGGMSRFGALATTLKKLSDRYVMLTPPYVALLCRTFITLEGLICDDPKMAEEFNIYEVALPFAVRRVLSPRTRRGQVNLRQALLDEEPSVRQRREEGKNIGVQPRWDTFASLLEDLEADAGSSTGDSVSTGEKDEFGATEAVQRRLFRTVEGAALRRFCYDVDIFDSLQSFLVSKDTRPLRRKVADALAFQLVGRWQLFRAGRRYKKPSYKRRLGPRSKAAAKAWGTFNRRSPYTLPTSTLKTSRRAWRVVLRRQICYMLMPPWRLPYRATVGVVRVSLALVGIGARALLRTRAVAAEAAATVDRG